jgi:6-pyruvoyltetrahydropterin/6-carboxytetrahydropterin synthase
MARMKIVKEFTFDAAHWLPQYPGPCGKLHGHSWRVQIGAAGPINPETGMIMDFSILKQVIQNLFSALDHSCLNACELKDFPKEMPTAENMVKWFTNKLHIGLLEHNVSLVLIRLWETPTSYCEWGE